MSRNHCLYVLVLLAAYALAAQNVRGQRIVAPYLDMGRGSRDVAAFQAQSGTRWTTLAFVNAGEGCEPTWPGMKSLSEDSIIYSSVQQARKHGGKVILAFGGYQGKDLAMACTDAKSLANAYSQAARRYGTQVLDFDVEHAALDDQVSIDRRSEAIAILKKRNPKFRIQLTLPATPRGLNAQCMSVLQSALQHGVRIDLLNVMTMDYAIPMPEGGMGAAAISAVNAVREQLRQLRLKTPLGITPMIGVNDSPQETFTLSDAQQIVAYAKQHDDIALLAFWSLARDNGTCTATIAPDCSGIAQGDWAFTNIFLQFR